MRFLKIGCFSAEDGLPAPILQTLHDFSLEPRISDGSRSRKIGDLTIILRNIVKQSGDAYLLDFTRLREVRRLPLSDQHGNEDEYSFEETNMRPADRCAAVLDLPSKCLLIQENGSGISHVTVGKYLCALIENEPPTLRFKIVMDGAAQARMLRSRGFQRFSIGLAKLGNVGDLASFGFSDHEILSLTSGLDATKLTINFGVDRQREEESLNVGKVVDLATTLLQLPKTYLRSLRLQPVEVDEDEPAIDLVKDRILVKHPISQPESEDLTDEVRYRAVNTAWRKYRDLLRDRYVPGAQG